MFEFAKIIVWVHFLKAFKNLSYLLIVLTAITTVVVFIVWTIGECGGFYENDLNNRLPHIALKILKRIVPVLIFCTLFAIFVPSPEKVVAYLSLRQVDKYNIEEVDSMYNPQEILGTVDAVLQRAQKWIEMDKNED